MHNRTIKKRHVFYLSGFDPRGVRYYYYLFKDEIAKYAQVNRIHNDVTSRKRLSAHSVGWEIQSEMNASNVHTLYEFLEWNDIIKAEWRSNIFTLLKDSILFYIFYSSNRVLSTSKQSGRLITLNYPSVYVIGSFLLSITGGSGIFMLFSGLVGSWIAALLALGSGYYMLKGFEYFSKKIGIVWLSNIYTFSDKFAKNPVWMEARIEFFAQRLKAVLQQVDTGEVDEIIFVAHSVGTILAVPIIEKVLKDRHCAELATTKLSLMTIGTCLGLVSVHKDAQTYRESLQVLAKDSNFKWLDFTSQADGICQPLYDFVQEAGLSRPEKHKQFILSPRFHLLFSKERYAVLKKDWLQFHFLYIMATESSEGYDFFKIITSQQPFEFYLPDQQP